MLIKVYPPSGLYPGTPMRLPDAFIEERGLEVQWVQCNAETALDAVTNALHYVDVEYNLRLAETVLERMIQEEREAREEAEEDERILSERMVRATWDDLERTER